MKIENQFTVDVAPERVWETLLDIERVAGFLPGATIVPSDEEGVYRGTMRVKLGPVTVNYKGSARLSEIDEHALRATLEVRAKDAQAQGTAMAMIVNQLVPENGGTRVIVETDLQVTGRQAQFGSGIMQDVAQRMLADFAQRFDRYLRDSEPTQTAATSADDVTASSAASAPASADGDVLDLGPALTRTLALRYGGRPARAVGRLISRLKRLFR